MESRFDRTEMLIGKDAILKLNMANVAVFGIGGVGSYCLEALVRAGVGSITVVDNDTVNVTNINRQLIATSKTVGMKKVDAAKLRCLEIAPDVNITAADMFFSPENSADFDFGKFDYVVDAIDSVTSKIELILSAQKYSVPIISSMGTGNKLDPTQLRVADIYKTSVCPLARVMRYELKKRGVKQLKTVFSPEIPIKTDARTPGSVSFVPGAAGLIMAGEVIKHLIG